MDSRRQKILAIQAKEENKNTSEEQCKLKFPTQVSVSYTFYFIIRFSMVARLAT